jgi:hypothetical protein
MSTLLTHFIDIKVMVFVKLRKNHPWNLIILGDGQTHKTKNNNFHNSKLKYTKLKD